MDIYDELYQALRAIIDPAIEAMIGVSEAVSFAAQTVEEAFQEFQEILNSVICTDSEETETRLRTAPKQLQRPCRKVVIHYNYIPVMARNLPYQRRAF